MKHVSLKTAETLEESTWYRKWNRLIIVLVIWNMTKLRVFMQNA